MSQQNEPAVNDPTAKAEDITVQNMADQDSSVQDINQQDPKQLTPNEAVSAFTLRFTADNIELIPIDFANSLRPP